jgi:SAM-dependent methyltransferase
MYEEDPLAHNWLIKRLVNDKVRARLAAFSGTVLDLGCGVRPFEQDILQFADRYVGVDWSQTLHGLKADVVADLNRPLPFADASIDHVVSFEVLEHLAEPAVMLAEAARVLRSQGQLTLSHPFQWWVHESPWDYQRFTRYGLDHQLRKAGFADIQVTETSGFWSMWLLKLNYQMTRLPRGPSWVRKMMRVMLIPVWWTTQWIGIGLDQAWKEPRETAGYFVVATKP